MSRDGLPARKVAIGIHSGGEPARSFLRAEERIATREALGSAPQWLCEESVITRTPAKSAARFRNRPSGEE
jgi:hypothetical protein